VVNDAHGAARWLHHFGFRLQEADELAEGQRDRSPSVRAQQVRGL
jgi:hypothetical protein